MGRAPCCDKNNVKKGPWSHEEDAKLKSYIEKHGTGGNWIALPHKIGLKRCGKSCRLRWLNYLRPNIKHGGFTEEEDDLICNLYINIGSRWSIIAAQLPGRTDNDIKNYWNTRLKKKLLNKQRCNNKQHKPPLLSETASTKKQEADVRSCKENHPILNVPYCFDQQEYYPSHEPYFFTDNLITMPQLESNMPSGHTIYSTNPDIRACDGSITSSFMNSTDFCNMICSDIANNFQEIGEIPDEILMCSTDQKKFDGLSDFAAISNMSSHHSWPSSTNNWNGIANSLVNYPNCVLPSYEVCNKEAARGWCIDDDQFVTL